MKKNCYNCKHGYWDGEHSSSEYYVCEKRDANNDSKLENNLYREEYREKAKICCELL